MQYQTNVWEQRIETLNAASKYRKKEAVSKTTMSVPEMRRMLGLGKTESYWLVHKHYFDMVLIEGKMRIVLRSFEKWYANQVKYKKVTGEEPGLELKKKSYSIREIANMLGISESHIYEILQQNGIETIVVDYWKRVPKEAFDSWYHGQTRYRTQKDRERDSEIENNSIWIPDMARLLGIPRDLAYYLVRGSKYKNMFEVIVVANRKRVTKVSFQQFLDSQEQYKLALSKDGTKRLRRSSYEIPEIYEKSRREDKTKKNSSLKYLRPDEAACIAGIERSRISQLIKEGAIPYKKHGNVVRIPRLEFEAWLRSREK